MSSQSFFKILLILIQLTTCRNTCYQPIVINRFKKNIRRISKRENDSLKCFIINYIKHFPWYFFFQKKCEKYWPDLMKESVFGKTKIILLSEKAYAYYVVRKMKVTSEEVWIIHLFCDLLYSIKYPILHLILIDYQNETVWNCNIYFNWQFKCFAERKKYLKK